MKTKKSLSALLIISLILLGSCGGGGSSSGDTGDPTGLYSATIYSNGTSIGAVVGDDAGNKFVSIMDSPGSDSVGTLIASLVNGNDVTVTMQNGRPVTVTDGSITATFSNWSGNTVDVTLTSDGETETVTGVDFSEYAAQSVEKGWPQFFGATWTAITVAFCPVSIALAGLSMGTGTPGAIIGCSLAAGNLYRLLNGQSTLVEEVAIYVSAPASCAAVAEDGGTAAEREQCASDTLTTLPSVASYVNADGEIVTPGDGGTTTFGGSCYMEANGTCVNYVGSSVDGATAQTSCQQTGGIYSSGACPTAGILGYCTVYGGTSNEYRVAFYDNVYPSVDVARQTCAAMSGTFSTS